jgi:hypothetical protein
VFDCWQMMSRQSSSDPVPRQNSALPPVLPLVEKKRLQAVLRSQLFAACRQGRLEECKSIMREMHTLEQLISNLANRKLPQPRNLMNELLLCACNRGQRAVTEWLLTQGADDLNGALLAASCGGNIDIVRDLLANNYFCYNKPFLNDSLCAAAVRGRLQIVQLMVAKGATHLNGALRFACESEHDRTDVIVWLTQNGAQDWDFALRGCKNPANIVTLFACGAQPGPSVFRGMFSHVRFHCISQLVRCEVQRCNNSSPERMLLLFHELLQCLWDEPAEVCGLLELVYGVLSPSDADVMCRLPLNNTHVMRWVMDKTKPVVPDNLKPQCCGANLLSRIRAKMLLNNGFPLQAVKACLCEPGACNNGCDIFLRKVESDRKKQCKQLNVCCRQWMYNNLIVNCIFPYVAHYIFMML